MKYGTSILPILAITTLAACGGSGTGNGLTYGVDTTLPTGGGVGAGFLEGSDLIAIGDANDALRNAIFDEGRYNTTEGTGMVNMTGFIGLSEVGRDDESIVGNMSLAIDYDMGNATGTIGDLAVFDQTSDTPVRVVDLTGTLNISGAAAGSGLGVDAIGNLSDGVDTYMVDIDLGGDLYDVDGTNTYVGGANGTYMVNGTTTGLEGEFVAQ